MKKCTRELIADNKMFGMYGVVHKIDNTYVVLMTHSDLGNNFLLPKYAAYIIAVGKELKGYLGDIIRITYDGEAYGTGDYRLVSDRHGVICKWKEVKRNGEISQPV